MIRALPGNLRRYSEHNVLLVNNPDGGNVFVGVGKDRLVFEAWNASKATNGWNVSCATLFVTTQERSLSTIFCVEPISRCDAG